MIQVFYGGPGTGYQVIPDDRWIHIEHPQAIRPSDFPLNSPPPGAVEGLYTQFYDLDGIAGLDAIPNYDNMTPMSQDVLSDINFYSHWGEMYNTGKNDFVGIRYQGYVKVPHSGIWDFGTNSDDGSKLYIGDQLIVENDKIQGATEVKRAIELEAGYH
jgi:hypothetical protein